MISSKTTLVAALLGAMLFSSVGTAQDLARYRGFFFGMSLEAVAKQINMDPLAVRTPHQRPAVIQTLQWDQSRYSVDSPEKDRSLRSIRFDFYNSELSKMVVTYDPVRTDGLTTNDMIEAISALYGPAAKPDRTIGVSTSSVFEDKQRVLASWENAEYSYNLFRSEYGNTFGLVAFSKRLELMASLSIAEAERLDKLEAPDRERARQLKDTEDKRTAQEKARLISKPSFRP